MSDALVRFLLPPPRLLACALLEALLQCVLEVDRAAMLAQQVAEGLVGELLEALHAVTRQEVERVPRFQIEFDALAALARLGGTYARALHRCRLAAGYDAQRRSGGCFRFACGGHRHHLRP